MLTISEVLKIHTNKNKPVVKKSKTRRAMRGKSTREIKITNMRKSLNLESPLQNPTKKTKLKKKKSRRSKRNALGMNRSFSNCYNKRRNKKDHNRCRSRQLKT